MTVWDALLKKIVNPVVNETVNKSINESKDKEKAAAFTKGLILYNTQRQFSPMTIGDYTITPKPFPRGATFKILRDFSYYYPILRACINYRKRQISQLEWDITPKEVIADTKIKEQYQKDAEKIKAFLKHPVGNRTLSFRDFVNKLMEDVIVLDAMAVYRQKKRVGGLYGYLPVDAATIDIVLNQDGTIPLPPNIAYMQKINGIVKAELTIEELIYKMMNPRTDTPYGFSPVETLILVVSTALKLGAYNLAYLTEGNVPEGFVELPKEIANDPDQLRQWQEAWDAMFSGDPRFQRKIKFLPEGMEWHPIKKPEDLEYQKFDQWLLLETCAVMEVPPQAIGFQMERGKGATEAEWEIGKERGLFPLANFLKEFFDEIIQEDLGQEHLEFVWTNINPTNKAEEAKVFDTLIRLGAVSVDEWRLGEGKAPIGLPHFIMSPIGPVLVKDLLGRSEAGKPILPGVTEPFKPEEMKPPKPVEGKVEEKLESETITRADIVNELKKWKRAAENDLKRGHGFRDFKTDIIDLRTKTLIKNGLITVKTKDDLDQLFDPLISQENQIISAVLDLYDEISEIANLKPKTYSKSN